MHMLYEQLKAKIITPQGLSKSFNNDIKVKQGCHVFPTMFNLYIDNIEQWINMKGGLGGIIIKILLYVDNLIVIVSTLHILQGHLKP